MSIIVMFLASAMILPVGMSYAQNSNVTATSPGVQTLSNQTNANKTVVMHSNSTINVNQTMTVSTNATVSETVNDTKTAQQVSDFIHQAVADFKQQGIETRQAMLDCRDKLQTASSGDVQNIRDVCTTNLSAIKAKYQVERSHYHDLVKQYRQSVMIFLSDARGLPVSKAALDNSFTQLGMMMHSASHGKMMGKAATMNNTSCTNPHGASKIC
jgi:hypothetical protein